MRCAVCGLRRGLVDLDPERDEAGEVLPAVAHRHHVAHDVGKLPPDVVLDGDGGDVLAAGRDDQLLDAAGDGEEAVAVVPFGTKRISV